MPSFSKYKIKEEFIQAVNKGMPELFLPYILNPEVSFGDLKPSVGYEYFRDFLSSLKEESPERWYCHIKDISETKQELSFYDQKHKQPRLTVYLKFGDKLVFDIMPF
tara:strand:- start:33734 stop:34054 length:321 start_codon:yes stop_codon:yes gene_type:complete